MYIPDVNGIINDTEILLGDPTKATQTQSSANTPHAKWIAVNALTRETVDTNIKQPDPGRTVLYARASAFGRISYTYYDDIPRWYHRIRILAMVFAILTTPLSLLCFLPALHHIKQVG